MNGPNFVVIMADDLGYGDLSCMGSEFRTPHLDRLAASGVRLANWYSNAPVCSPSRAALLSGRYPQRTGVTHILGGRRGAVPGFAAGVPTFAEALRDRAGYRTAHVGKWHLGTDLEALPDRHGFDRWFGFTAGCFDYYSHLFYYGGFNPVHDLWDNGREIYRNGEYATHLWTDEAIGVLRAWRREQSERPFCLYRLQRATLSDARTGRISRPVPRAAAGSAHHGGDGVLYGRWHRPAARRARSTGDH